MTYPTIYPSRFDGTANDFLKCKVDRSGAARLIEESVTIPASTTAPANIGLHPFRKGARLSYASSVRVTDLDTASNAVIDLGWVYKDNDTVTYINDTDGFVDGSTHAIAGGIIALNVQGASAGYDFVALADGWFIAQVEAGPTTTAGTIKTHLIVSYDS